MCGYVADDAAISLRHPYKKIQIEFMSALESYGGLLSTTRVADIVGVNRDKKNESMLLNGPTWCDV